jgi:hypothetical protein
LASWPVSLSPALIAASLHRKLADETQQLVATNEAPAAELDRSKPARAQQFVDQAAAGRASSAAARPPRALRVDSTALLMMRGLDDWRRLLWWRSRAGLLLAFSDGSAQVRCNMINWNTDRAKLR